MNLRALLKDCVPPVGRKLYQRYLRRYGYLGLYPTWAAAQAQAGGYEDPGVVAAMVASTRRAYRGEEALPPLSWPLLAACLAAARGGTRPVTLLDFGGALGVTWYNLQPWLADPTTWRCAVVEQPAIAAAGQAEFAGPGLHFYGDLASALADGPPQVIYLSSVLQYLPTPYATLEQLLACQAEYLLIDRQPCSRTGADQLTLQIPHASVYHGSYPAWLLVPERLQQLATAHGYLPAVPMPQREQDWRADYRGFLFRRATT